MCMYTIATLQLEGTSTFATQYNCVFFLSIISCAVQSVAEFFPLDSAYFTSLSNLTYIKLNFAINLAADQLGVVFYTVPVSS